MSERAHGRAGWVGEWVGGRAAGRELDRRRGGGEGGWAPQACRVGALRTGRDVMKPVAMVPAAVSAVPVHMSGLRPTVSHTRPRGTLSSSVAAAGAARTIPTPVAPIVPPVICAAKSGMTGTIWEKPKFSITCDVVRMARFLTSWRSSGFFGSSPSSSSLHPAAPRPSPPPRGGVAGAGVDDDDRQYRAADRRHRCGRATRLATCGRAARRRRCRLIIVRCGRPRAATHTAVVRCCCPRPPRSLGDRGGGSEKRRVAHVSVH